MEKQKSVIVLRQRKEKAHEGISDGFVKAEDIVKSSIYRNVKKLETGETIVANHSKVRREKGVESGEGPEKNVHSAAGQLLVRRLIKKVTVYDERFEVEFKSGAKVDVER